MRARDAAYRKAGIFEKRTKASKCKTLPILSRRCRERIARGPVPQSEASVANRLERDPSCKRSLSPSRSPIPVGARLSCRPLQSPCECSILALRNGKRREGHISHAFTLPTWGSVAMIRQLSFATCCFLFLASVLIGREWTDRSEKHRVEATLVEVGDGSVRLKKPDGKVVTLALDELSQADRDFLANESGEPAEREDKQDSPAQQKKGATSGPLLTATTFAGLEA